ncbi:CDPK-related kinase 3-like [Iris pallida]|uniref:CDPK-related kinase 3-like n=1 Tax=Iris pallida TaxID=29817 RepID=A0AAX6IAT0_IRIPA|nr:CDPK-related kinase 3-like [Iris pallida]
MGKEVGAGGTSGTPALPESRRGTSRARSSLSKPSPRPRSSPSRPPRVAYRHPKPRSTKSNYRPIIQLGRASPRTTSPSPFCNASLPITAHVASLVFFLILLKKILQLTYNTSAVPRLEVPAYDWWSNSLYGPPPCIFLVK